MPTADELAMLQQYGGQDFSNQDWNAILKAISSFSPDQLDGSVLNSSAAGIGIAPGANGWYMDSYQPWQNGGSPYDQLTRFASNQANDPSGMSRYDTVTVDPKTGKVVNQWQQYNNNDSNTLGYLTPFLALTGAGMMLGPMAAGDATAAGAADSGSFAIPSADELSAAGFGDGTGMGMTGAGGIGSASSVAGAGAGAAGYGTTAGSLFSIPTSDELQSAGFGDGTGVPMTGPGGIGSASSVAEGLGPSAFTDAGYGATSGLSDLLKSALTPSNIGKLASALKGGSSGNGSGGTSGFGGVPNEIANTTPGMIAQPTQQQKMMSKIAPILLGNYAQPQFNFNDYS